LRRTHFFEIHDQAWFPKPLRDGVTDALEFILGLGSLYAPIIPRLRRALEETGTHRVVDLCSGGGGPWLWMHRIFEKQENFPVDVCLTDKYPNVEAFVYERTASLEKITFHAEPVDARQIPSTLKGFRTLFTSFHHFRPEEARAILQDTVEHQQGIGIFELAGREPLTILLVFLVPVAVLGVTPFIRPFRWSRLIWTYLLPVIPLVLLFDGIVSCLRTYSPPELSDLTSELSPSGYTWEIGKERTGILSIPITYLIGHASVAADPVMRE